MATTRGGSKSTSASASASKKRAAASEAAENAPAKKRGRQAKKPAAAKKQTTIENTVNADVKADNTKDEIEVEKSGVNGKTKAAKNKSGSQKLTDDALKNADSIEDDAGVTSQIEEEKTNESKPDDSEKPKGSKDVQNGHVQSETEENSNEGAKEKESNVVKDGEKNAFDEVKADKNDVHKAAEKKQESKSESIAHNESVMEDPKRKAAIPSSILEKGIIYFFFRGRVGIEDPHGIEDVARSYIVLRPIPIGAKLGGGPLVDSGNARLLALPKKMLPKSHRDRFLMFTEKVHSSIKDLRDQFAGNEYVTKTSGTSHTPAATPFAEGVYAITSTGRESHLAYQLTVPSKIGEVQKELGLNEKGSFVCSVKNPEAAGPAYATIGNPAKYTEELQKKFRGLRWMPLEPEHLDYEGTQFLVIGEGLGSFGKAVEEMSKDKKDDGKEKPEEEMEKLEEEDHDRVENLKEDDPVFADLGLSSKEYSKMQTTW